MKLFLSSLLIIATLSSCSMNNSRAPSMAPLASYSFGKTKSYSTPRNIIKSGSLSMRVKEIDSAVGEAESIVLTSGGHIVKLRTEEVSAEKASLKVKVPSVLLAATMIELESLGKVKSKKVWLEDKTEARILADAHLELLNSRRARIKQLIASTKDTSDKIDLERLLSEVEEELFKMKAAQKAFKSRESLSDLSLDFYRTEIRGPITVVTESFSWAFGKLFILRD